MAAKPRWKPCGLAISPRWTCVVHCAIKLILCFQVTFRCNKKRVSIGSIWLGRVSLRGLWLRNRGFDQLNQVRDIKNGVSDPFVRWMKSISIAQTSQLLRIQIPLLSSLIRTSHFLSKMLVRSKRSKPRLRSVKPTVLEISALPPLPCNDFNGDTRDSNPFIQHPPTPPNDLHSSDLADNESIECDAAFWKESLSGFATSSFPRLPHSCYKPRPRSHVTGPSCGLRGCDSQDLPDSQVVGLICAAWSLVISYHNESQDSLFGLHFSGTDAADGGYQIRALPIRALVDGKKSVKVFLKEVQNWSERIKSTKLRLEDIRALDSDIDAACNFQTTVDFRSLSSAPTGKWCKSRSIGQSNVLEYGIVLECVQHCQDLSFCAHFDERLVLPDTMRLMLFGMEHMMWSLLRVRDSKETLDNLQVLSPADRRQILQHNRP